LRCFLEFFAKGLFFTVIISYQNLSPRTPLELSTRNFWMQWKFPEIKFRSEVWPEVSRIWSFLSVLVIVWSREVDSAFDFMTRWTRSELKVLWRKNAKWWRSSYEKKDDATVNIPFWCLSLTNEWFQHYLLNALSVNYSLNVPSTNT